MTNQSIQLLDSRTGQRVHAEVHVALSIVDVYDAEAAWAPARVRIRQKVKEARLPRTVVPQSTHWDWSRKLDAMDESRLLPLGDARLIGIRQADQWQGLVWVESMNMHGAEHRTKLGNTNRPMAYIPWLETAPWNWDIPPEPTNAKGAVQQRRFRGLGILLMTYAVLWSDQQGFNGRLGLHSLPQSERFYRLNCGMTDLGPDPKYQRLRYFEFEEAQATTFLEGK